MKKVRYIIDIETDPDDLAARFTKAKITRISGDGDKYNKSNPINDQLHLHKTEYRGMDAELFISMFKSMCLDNDYTDSMNKLEKKESD